MLICCNKTVVFIPLVSHSVFRCGENVVKILLKSLVSVAVSKISDYLHECFVLLAMLLKLENETTTNLCRILIAEWIDYEQF